MHHSSLVVITDIMLLSLSLSLSPQNAQGRTATHDIDGVIARVQASSAERSYQAERSLNMVRTGIVSKRPAVGASRPATARLDPFNAPRPKREIIKKPSFPWKRR